MKTIQGLVILNKEEGMTSQTAVSRVRRLFGADKAGHSGTLDPMATGVLPVMLGRATAASELLLSGDKHYIATLRLGLTTDTEDVTGEVLSRHEGALPTAAEVTAAAAAFLGESLQTPPMYSALKQGGRKLCDLARQGVTVEREPRPITVHRLEVTPLGGSDYRLLVVCSKGTYIRTLCADIGARLGVGGVMATLTRASAAGFSLAEAHTLSELESMSEEERERALIPTEALFSSLDAVCLPPFFARLARSGAEIYERKIGTAYPVGTRLRMCDGEGFFALGEVREFEEGLAIKPIKMFSVK
jgi:tRNA pseudouridine55 synthase